MTSAGTYHPSLRWAPHVFHLPLNSACPHAFCGLEATREDGGGAVTFTCSPEHGSRKAHVLPVLFTVV